jgi:hypothetical protein
MNKTCTGVNWRTINKRRKRNKNKRTHIVQGKEVKADRKVDSIK